MGIPPELLRLLGGRLPIAGLDPNAPGASRENAIPLPPLAVTARGPHATEFEDGSREVFPDIAMRPDASAVRMPMQPTDYRAFPLPANFARSPLVPQVKGESYEEKDAMPAHLGKSPLSPPDMPHHLRPVRAPAAKALARIRGTLREHIAEDPWWSTTAAPDETRAGQYMREFGRDHRTLPTAYARPPEKYDEFAPPSNTLDAVYARPPSSWSGNTIGLNTGPSNNVEDRRQEQEIPPGFLEALLNSVLKRGGDAERWMADPHNMRPRQ